MQKEFTKYTQNDITLFISNKIKQSNSLNFCDASSLIPGNDKKEQLLSKYISAFANSGGGTIIFGIKKFKERANELDILHFKDISTFWLKNLIENEISPLIENIEI